ncbi:hypothetical protein BH24BAC1_BH24BAC1_15920 [soil metagenome]
MAEVTHNYNHSFYYDEQDQRHIWPGYDAFPQTDSAISYIRRQQDKPFLLVLSWGPPHDPYFTAPDKFQQMYDRQKINLRPNIPAALEDSARRVLASYYAHCSALDQALGELLETLEQQGIADNTILVFTSDHGDMLLSKGQLKKQRPWDESMLVPLLVRYPAALGRRAQEKNQPINTPDLLPTLLGLSGIEIPGTVEGRDLSGALKSGEELPEDGALVILPVPFHEWNFSKGGREYRAVRTRQYTYARDLSGPWLLYDNEQDPFQDHNLVGNPQFAQVQARLEAMLQQKLKDTNDSFLPADEYMTKWKYRYDGNDSLRPASYYSALKKQ